MEKNSIIFLGTPTISAYVLEGLINNNFNVVACITKEDKVRGRNNEIKESDVALIAKKYNIPCYKPHKLNLECDFIDQYNPDLLLTFAYGQILSTKVLAKCRYKPLNLHASLLPKYRGAAPIQYALLNGEKETGVSLMEMVKEMDAGDIYASATINIDKDDNYTSLSEKISRCSLDLAIKNLPLYFENKLTPIKQDETKATFCPSIKKDEEHLALDSCQSFINKVRALSFTPGAYLLFNDEMIKIYKASYFNDKIEGGIGKVIFAHKKNIILQLNDGQVRIEILQRPGKKMMDAASFNNGFKLEGMILR